MASYRGKRVLKKCRLTPLAAAALLMVLVMSVGGTLAWLTAHTNAITNTFTVATPGVEIEEGFDKQTKSNVQVKNTGEVEAYIRDNPDMVAGYSKTGGGTVAWAAAKELNGREDILAVGYDYTKKNLDVVSEGGAVALIAQPLYDEGYTGLELIDEMLHGKAFNASESLWYQKLDAPLVYPGGEGVHGAAMYYDMYARSEARFGINKQWEGI